MGIEPTGAALPPLDVRDRRQATRLGDSVGVNSVLRSWLLSRLTMASSRNWHAAAATTIGVSSRWFFRRQRFGCAATGIKTSLRRMNQGVKGGL